MKTINKSTIKQIVIFLAAWLEKLGLGSIWARTIAIAVIAAAIAYFSITVTGCSNMPKITFEHPRYGNIVIHQNYKK